MTRESLRTVRDHLSEYVDRVQREHERVVVTRNGRPVAVLLSLDDLEGLEETAAALSRQDLLTGIREGRNAIDRGDFVEGVDAIAALRRSE